MAATAKAATATGKPRSGDGTRRALQHGWTRPKAFSASLEDGGVGGWGLRSGTSNEAGLALDLQAAALGLYT